MRAHYVLTCLALLVATTGAANIRPSVTAVNNQLYRRFVCVNKSNGFRALVPGSCSKYYECQNGVAMETTCSRFFDPKVQGCVTYNTGCVEVMQTSAAALIGGNSGTAAEPCAETVTTTCVPPVTTTCETTTPCKPETTTTTCTTPKTTTCTTPTTTTCSTVTTTTCTTPTTTTCSTVTTTTCTTPTTTTCTTPTTTTCTTPTTTTCTTPTTTTCTTPTTTT
ncbi:uncharacterized protein Dvir_GJ26340, partial [Drosophila virilis]